MKSYHRPCSMRWSEWEIRALLELYEPKPAGDYPMIKLREPVTSKYSIASKHYGVVAAAASGLLRGPLRFRPLRGPAAPPCTSLDLARSTRLRQPTIARNADMTPERRQAES